MVDNYRNGVSAVKSINESKSNLDYEYFINSTSKKYQPQALRNLAVIFDTLPEGKVNLALGFPNAETFPLQDIKVSLKNGSSFILEGKTLNTALQYGISGGNADLCDWLKQFQEKIHGPLSWKNYDLILSCGSQEALFFIILTILEIGDAIIMQTPSYPGALGVLKPKNIEMIPLHADIEGVKIEPLRQLLKERSISGKPMPKLLMVNPVGGNPSGVTIPEKEKEEIYKLACQYNFLILEDDPYYFLSFSDKNPRSFLSMDSEKRVVRLDSFSKIVSPGLRVGFITGPTQILEKVVYYLQSASVHPSSLSQVLIHEFLKRWQYDGFMQHIREVKMFYQKNRDIMLRSIETHLKGLVEYVIPSAGFFIWLRLKSIQDSKHFAGTKCLKNLILVSPGFIFYDEEDQKYSYIRLSYSCVNNDQIDRVISVLATLIRQEIADKK